MKVSTAFATTMMKKNANFFIQDAAEKCMRYIYTELRTGWCEENEWSNTSNIDAHEKIYIHVC